MRVVQKVRFSGRSPVDGAIRSLEQLSEIADLVLVTGRSELIEVDLERWLRRNGLAGLFRDVYTRPHGVAAHVHKLNTLRLVNADAFVEDEAQIANYLASRLRSQVYFLSRESPNVPLGPSVKRVRGLAELATHLQRGRG
jgi:hypothetical protein